MFAKPKTRVGLDIGSFSIKAVEVIEKPKGVLELLKIGVGKVEYEGPQANLSASIKRAMHEANISTNRVHASISGQAVIVRYIILPKMTKTELQSAMRFEAEKYIPFDIKEVVLDSQILDENMEDNKMKVLLVAAKKDSIHKYTNAIIEAGFEPILIDVDSFALINSFSANFPQASGETTALLNIGAQLTNINILKDNTSRFTRDIQIAGNEITNALSKQLNISLEEAEGLKCNPGERFDEVFEIVKTVLEEIVREVRLSFDYYESQFEKGVDKVYLSGGSSALKGIENYISQAIGLETDLWDPSKCLQISQDALRQSVAPLASRMAVGIGLALRKVE